MEQNLEKVVEFLKDQREVEYDMNFIKDKNLGSSSNGSKGAENIVTGKQIGRAHV